MAKEQGHSYLQMTFPSLQATLDFQVPDGTQGSNPTQMHPLPPPQVPPGRPARGNAFLLCLYHLPGLYHFLPCAKALYECVLSPQLDCELFAAWDHVLFIFASPTASNIVSGSQSAPSTRLWDTQMDSRGNGRKRGPWVAGVLSILTLHHSPVCPRKVHCGSPALSPR